jgi:predicted TPR repeat methyltransferase
MNTLATRGILVILKMAPEFAIARLNTGRALDQAGRLEEAVKEYLILLQKAAPDDHSIAAQARQRLAALQRQRQE